MSGQLSPQDLDFLKTQVWKRKFSSEETQLADHFFRLIASDIRKWIKHIQLPRPALHWHTIRNFYQGKSTPQLSTLDLLASYAADSNRLLTFHEFHQLAKKVPAQTTQPHLTSLPNGKWRVKVTVEVPLVLEIESLPGLEIFQEE